MYTNPLNSCYGNSCVSGLTRSANQAGQADAGTPTQAATDSLSLDALNSVPEFLYGKIVDALNKEFGVSVTATTPSDAAPTTFEDVVDRLKGVIAQLTATGATPGGVSTRVGNALQQAVQDSKDVLTHYGKLDANTEQQIDDVAAALLAQTADNATAAAAPPTTTDSIAAATFSSIDRSQSTSIQIKTRAGDLVTIALSNQFGASVTTAHGASNGVEIAAQRLTSHQSSQLSFSVQGNLNEDERDAIEKILGKVDKIADKFYSGNVMAAFKKASHLGFDAEMLVGVSLSMNYTETTKAISAYQTVGTHTAPAVTPATTGTLPDAAQFAQGVHDIVTDPAAQTVLADPAQNLGKLLESAMQLKNDTRHPAEHSLEDLTKALKAIIDAVVNLANTASSTSLPQSESQAIAA